MSNDNLKQFYGKVYRDKILQMNKKKQETPKDLTQEVLRGILPESQSGKEMDEGDKLNDERYRE